MCVCNFSFPPQSPIIVMLDTDRSQLTQEPQMHSQESASFQFPALLHRAGVAGGWGGDERGEKKAGGHGPVQNPASSFKIQDCVVSQTSPG